MKQNLKNTLKEIVNKWKLSGHTHPCARTHHIKLNFTVI